MRFKPVPDPNAGVSLEDVKAAVPIVPRPTADCCARLVDRTAIPSRDVAKTWLTFCRALGLVAVTDSGWVRADRAPTPEAVREAFIENVYGVSELLETLSAANEPLDADSIADRLDIVPRWAGHRDVDTESRWRDRIGNLCEWAVRFELMAYVDSGYRPVTRESRR